MINFVNFSAKNYLLNLLLGLGLKLILHWKAQLLILLKSLFESVVVELIFWTIQKRKVPFANNFEFEVKSCDKSLI